MDPNSIIRDIFVWIAVPILGLIVIASIMAGKIKVLGLTVLALIVAAMFVYMPAGTLTSIGTSAASGLSKFLG